VTSFLALNIGYRICRHPIFHIYPSCPLRHFHSHSRQIPLSKPSTVKPFKNQRQSGRRTWRIRQPHSKRHIYVIHLKNILDLRPLPGPSVLNTDVLASIQDCTNIYLLTAYISEGVFQTILQYFSGNVTTDIVNRYYRRESAGAPSGQLSLWVPWNM